jgi:hypothetical protein
MRDSWWIVAGFIVFTIIGAVLGYILGAVQW